MVARLLVTPVPSGSLVPGVRSGRAADRSRGTREPSPGTPLWQSV